MNVDSQRCGHLGCNEQPSFGVEVNQKPEFCAGHAKEGTVNARSGRVFGRETNSSSAGDVSVGGGSAVDYTASGVGERTKRKHRTPPTGERETPSTSKRTKRASAPVTVKVEGDLSLSALSGAAEAVRCVRCVYRL